MQSICGFFCVLGQSCERCGQLDARCTKHWPAQPHPPLFGGPVLTCSSSAHLRCVLPQAAPPARGIRNRSAVCLSVLLLCCGTPHREAQGIKAEPFQSTSPVLLPNLFFRTNISTLPAFPTMFSQLILLAVVATSAIATPLRRDDPSPVCPRFDRSSPPVRFSGGGNSLNNDSPNTANCTYSSVCTYAIPDGTLLNGDVVPNCPLAITNKKAPGFCPFRNAINFPLLDGFTTSGSLNSTVCSYANTAPCVYVNQQLTTGGLNCTKSQSD
ncbi:hypothetical protein DFH06DRAFT_1483429 [Mycena polygramma]|nr:hypothetical protein DFH06DRAFT_1483429 [Mycena polygramma]